MSSFGGFPPQMFAFFEGLARDTSKAYWTANKATWEEHIRQPMLALLADLYEEFPPMRMFRPHRDVRFAKDKSPYKLWAGATSQSRAIGGTGYYLEVSAAGLVTGYGAMAMALTSSGDSGPHSMTTTAAKSSTTSAPPSPPDRCP